MDPLTSIPIYTTFEDFDTTADHSWFPICPPSTTIFPSYTGTLHPFNTYFAPCSVQQPFTDLVYTLITTGKVTLSTTNEYHIADITTFKATCSQLLITFEHPPVLLFTSPTSNPKYFDLVSEYYKLFATAHRTSTDPTYTTALDTRAVAAPIDLTAGDNTDSEYSDSSYETVAPTRHPTTGEILAITRIHAYNHAVRCANLRNAKRASADPSYTYTPDEELPVPTPRKRNHLNKK